MYLMGLARCNCGLFGKKNLDCITYSPEGVCGGAGSGSGVGSTISGTVCVGTGTGSGSVDGGRTALRSCTTRMLTPARARGLGTSIATHDCLTSAIGSVGLSLSLVSLWVLSGSSSTTGGGLTNSMFFVLSR